jgi:hypothetical protein
MYSAQSSHLLMHGLGHRFPQMGDDVYGEFAERMVSIVFGGGQPCAPAPAPVPVPVPMTAAVPVPVPKPEPQTIAISPQAGLSQNERSF